MPYSLSRDDVTARVLSPPRTLDWIVILRWHAIGAQAVLVAFARWMLAPQVPAPAMGAVVLAVAVSNVLLQRHLRQRGPTVEGRWVSGVIGFDVVALTALLALARTGEAPFAMAYLVLVLVAALALSPWRAVGVLGMACAGYGAVLLLDTRAAPDARRGTWIAFAVTGTIITAVVTRFATALREQWAALESAKALGTRARTIASLGNLAAGAAHELNTPLGTIAILANELSRVIDDDPAQAIDDAFVIRDQVDRCRTIVQRLAARTPEQIREEPKAITVERIRIETTAMLPYGEIDRVVWKTNELEGLVLPGEGLAQTLASLITNALQATVVLRGKVTVAVSGTRATVRFSVVDEGPGIPAQIRARLGEPFVTTKAPGEGMGLGIFLCQSFAEAWGAVLQFDDDPAGGTRVSLELPRRSTARKDAA